MALACSHMQLAASALMPRLLQVLWHLGTDVKQFLPRLGAPITSITACTHDFAKFVVALANNTIRVVRPPDSLLLLSFFQFFFFSSSPVLLFFLQWQPTPPALGPLCL